MRPLQFFAVVVLTLGTLSARDVDTTAGWGGVAWGATEEDVLLAYPQAKRHAFFLFKHDGADYGTTLTIDAYKFEGVAFRVDFLEDGNRRLIGVELVRHGGSKDDWSLLDKNFTKSFGAPALSHDGDLAHDWHTWLLPSLEVRLDFYKRQSAVTVFYLKPSDPAALK
jgi:hypothetical protein